MECIKKRRSVRRYKRKEIPMDDILKILDAGRLAPSAGNIQGWIFIVVRDKEKKKKLAEASYNQNWMADAGAIIVVCADFEKYKFYYGERGERLYAIMDASAAAENMILAATDLGYGSCWVSAFEDEKVMEILGMNPEKSIRPLILITIGVPISWPESPPKKKLEAVTRWEDIKTEVPK